MKKFLASICLVGIILGCLAGCGSEPKDRNPNLDTSKEVTLVLCGGWVESPAIELIAQKFNEKYPNCTVVYEYLQNYADSLETRLAGTDNKLDIFFTNNIQADSLYLPYALELFSLSDSLDLSTVHQGLIKNFTFMDSDSKASPKIYAVPIGSELRGIFVNKTLLSSLALETPSNRTEFLDACATLSQNGYVPIQANPMSAGQHLMYPYVCNLIANADDYQSTYARVNSCEPGVSELFRDPCSFLYTLMENNYYNYKYVETELGAFTNSSSDAIARDFLNIKTDAAGEYAKIDDLGSVAFMPNTMSLSQTMDRIKDDYHSEIDYEFVLAPVSDEGGFAYMSPASGIAINKASDNLDWAIEFLDFFFEPENNKAFAKASNIIPCTPDALNYITEKFDIPENRVCQLGQVSFDYGFFTLINKTLLNISKGNNPKYMDTDSEGHATLYPFEYYMAELENSFAEQREQLGGKGE